MATKVTTQLVDDVDGGTADLTIRFSLEGKDYEIDLSTKNAEKLRKAFDPWLEAARKLTRTGAPIRRTRLAPDPAAVRAWAESRGKKVNTRGRIPQDLVDEYTAATGG